MGFSIKSKSSLAQVVAIAVVLFGLAAFPSATKAALNTPLIDGGSVQSACQSLQTPPPAPNYDAYRNVQCDSNGYLLISPLTAAGGQYVANPAPLQNGQYTAPVTNNLGQLVVAPATPFPVTVNQIQTIIDRSNTVATASLSQVILPANPIRDGFCIDDLSPDVMWINDIGGLAVVGRPSFPVRPGENYCTPITYQPKSSVQLIDPVAGDSFTIREY